jgi:hypothetical protein
VYLSGEGIFQVPPELALWYFVGLILEIKSTFRVNLVALDADLRVLFEATDGHLVDRDGPIQFLLALRVKIGSRRPLILFHRLQCVILVSGEVNRVPCVVDS